MFDTGAKGLSPLQAFEAVMGFARRRGDAALRLALHASVPQVVHVDLMQLLRLNFVKDGQRPGVVEADVLFAPFCTDLGNGYFRFDDNARLQLLQQLDLAHTTPGSERSVEVADFLLSYFDRERAGERGNVDPLYRSWLEIERWNALAFGDPEATAEQLAAAVQHACTPGQTSARLRVGTLATSLATPLAQHHRLLHYAAGIEALQSQSADAERLLEAVGDEPLQVGRVVLPGMGELLKTMQRPAPAPAPNSAQSPAPASKPSEAKSKAAPRADETPTVRLRELRDCEYTAYISYAHADAEVWAKWVTDFGSELERGLRSMMREVHLPPIYIADTAGSFAAGLSEQMRQRLEATWSLILVVHHNYVISDWCLQELDVFRSIVGEEGLRDRLYIVAISEPAMQRLSRSQHWRQLLPADHLLWMPFYDTEDTARPLDIYLKSGRVAPAFRLPFEHLCDDMVAKLRQGIGNMPPAPAAEAAAAHAATEQAVPFAKPISVRLFIESNSNEVREWKLIGEQIRRRWRTLLDERRIDLPLNLRPIGLNIDEIHLFNLDDADGLILLWGMKSAQTLISQINLVEDRLRELAPAIVADLRAPKERAEHAVPALQWPVLRFSRNEHSLPQDLRPEAEVEGELTLFLADVLDRTSRRHKLQIPTA